MSRDGIISCLVIVYLLGLGAIGGFFAGVYGVRNKTRQEAVNAGVAYYEVTKTGNVKFKWKEVKE